MAITTVDQLVEAFATRRQKTPISKSGVSSPLAGSIASYWRGAGNPAIGNIPTTPASCNNNTLGAIPFTNPASGLSTYIARLNVSSTVISGFEVHDRLAHMGGLSGVLTTSQAVALDLFALDGTDNISARKVSADYSKVQWWIELFSGLGATVPTFTITYTDGNGVSGKTTSVVASNGQRVGSMFAITPANGDFIRSIESVQLNVSSGTAGNFGFVATVQRTEMAAPVANLSFTYDWAQVGLPMVHDSSCLMFLGIIVSGMGAIGGGITLVQG
jgi:hypothetical protein